MTTSSYGNTSTYQLRCRECGKAWGNQPRSICEDCFSPLEVTYDYDSIRPRISRQLIASRAPNIWRYRELLPLPAGFEPTLPVGFTPLLEAPRLGEKIGSRKFLVKNDAVCLPTLSFKDRVVAVALANARSFGFDTVACSSTGNLANSVAAQAAREGLKAWIFIPSDLEPAKILGTQVFGAELVRINGSYDHVNRLCSQIADEHRWGFVNVNLRPYYAEGSKTVGYEIAEQLGWTLPDNIVVPMAGGSLITKIKKAFDELILLGLVDPKSVKFFGAQATGCSPISTAVKQCCFGNRTAAPENDCAIARNRQSGRRSLRDKSYQQERRMVGRCLRRGSGHRHSVAGGERRYLHRNCRRRHRWMRAQVDPAGPNFARRDDGALHNRQRVENHRCSRRQVSG